MIPEFFVDRCCGKNFYQRLHGAGITAHFGDDHFDQTATGKRWLAWVGSRGWYVLTLDKAILTTPDARSTVYSSRVGFFVLVSAVKTEDYATAIVASKRSLLRFIERQHRPFIAKVYCQRIGKRQRVLKLRIGLV